VATFTALVATAAPCGVNLPGLAQPSIKANPIIAIFFTGYSPGLPYHSLCLMFQVQSN
jgi:hypothetical protein